MINCVLSDYLILRHIVEDLIILENSFGVVYNTDILKNVSFYDYSSHNITATLDLESEGEPCNHLSASGEYLFCSMSSLKQVVVYNASDLNSLSVYNITEKDLPGIILFDP